MRRRGRGCVAGCGDEQSRSGRVPGDTLTIFSSLPLQGPHADQAQSIVNAQKLALREAGGKVGDFKINFASADDATAGGDRVGWDPDKTAENARKSVENTRTIAYIGDFDSGATAISLPITNEAGFAQVSPASTAIGLTKFVPGAVEAGEPDKFYPGGNRSFARVVPADDVQASAAARWTRRLGARTVFVLGDRSLEGDGLAELYLMAAKDAGLRVVGQERMDPARRGIPGPRARDRARPARRRLLRRRRGQQLGAAVARPPRGRSGRAEGRLPQPARARVLRTCSAPPAHART